MNTDRTHWVDYARGIGIMLVVYGHVARGVFNAGIPVPAGVYDLADRVIYSFHMPLFFFLSGLFFVHTLKKKGPGMLLLGKVDTLLYPYLLWSILQGCIEVFLARHANGSVTLGDVFSLLWQPRAQFWFLYALFFVFAFATLLYSACRVKQHGFVLILSILMYLLQPILFTPMIPNFIAGHFVFFCFGIVFDSWVRTDSISSTPGLLLLACLFAGGHWVFHVAYELSPSDRGLPLLALACVSIVFVVSLSERLARMNIKPLAYVGASSMAIFLMHILAGSGMRVVLTRLFGELSFAIHVLAGCAAGILLPLLAAGILKKLQISWVFSAPLSELFFKTRRKPAPPLG